MAVNALLPTITKQMPPHELEAWNKFNRVPRSKEERRDWKKAYRKRQKALGEK